MPAPTVFRRILSDGAALGAWFTALRLISCLPVLAKGLAADPRVQDRTLSLRLGWLVDMALDDHETAPVYLRQWPADDWPPVLYHATQVLLEPDLDIFVPSANLWIGTRGTFTPVHSDDEDNLLVQLHGRKSVRLWPPEIRGGKGPLVGIESTFLHAHVCLGVGDMLFLPKGWAHEVTAIDGAISLNIWRADLACFLAADQR